MEEEDSKKNHIYKHLVISGGATAGLTYYGALKESCAQKIWNIENIQTIYGTSIGAIIACMLALKYEFDVLDNYIINRPWQQIFKYDMFTILDSITNRGIYNIKVIEEMFAPLLACNDLSIDITMQDFFDWSGIEIHIIAVELLSFTLVDFSYKTHPEWRVMDAVFCSSSLPVIMTPFFKDGKVYCDGGFLANYPINECLNNGADPNEVLGFARSAILKSVDITDESNLLDYIVTIVSKICENIVMMPKLKTIKLEYLLDTDPSSFSNMFKAFNNREERERLINIGVDYVKKYYETPMHD
jgi:predicted acylesterase/phospholipase RssA